MEKLLMCRICLVEDIRMCAVVKNIQELYERLTGIPFVTEDSRPNLVCFICCSKLKQCCQLWNKSLQAEELYSQMLNKDYKPNPLVPLWPYMVFNSFVKTEIETISIVDVQTLIKEESPATCEKLHDDIEPQEEYLSDDFKLENLDSAEPDVEDIPPHQSETDSEDDITLMDLKIEVEEDKLFKSNRRASDTESSPVGVAKKSKLKDTITGQQHKTEQSNSKFIRTATSKYVTKVEEPRTYTKPKGNNRSSDTILKSNNKNEIVHPILCKEENWQCEICERSFSRKCHLVVHSRSHTSERRFKCDVCPRSYVNKSSLTTHKRTHSGNHTHKCEFCERSFSSMNQLASHNSTHTPLHPYKCETCELSFNRMSRLSTHIRTHTCTREKPLKCDICQQVFSKNINLADHIRTNTCLKTHQCPMCKQSFSRESRLSTHIRTSHR